MTMTTDKERMRDYGRILCNPMLIAPTYRERLSLQSRNFVDCSEIDDDRERVGPFNYPRFWLLRMSPQMSPRRKRPDKRSSWKTGFRKLRRREPSSSPTRLVPGNRLTITDFQVNWRYRGNAPIEPWRASRVPFKVDRGVVAATLAGAVPEAKVQVTSLADAAFDFGGVGQKADRARYSLAHNDENK